MVHPNSIEAYHDLELGGTQAEIYMIYKNDQRPFTDRQVLRIFMHGRRGDMNQVRPRITEILNMPNTPIKEVGSMVCETSKRRVRACMYVPTTAKQDNFDVPK